MATILIVEDDLAIAVGLEDDLTMEGYTVEVVSAGDVAVTHARAKRFDLILLDVMLPRKDGFEVCRELRKTGIQSAIVLLTAKSGESDKLLGLDLGADDYITKPFSSRELRSRIKAVLRRCSPQTMEVACFGEIEVDFARAEVRRGRQPIDFTAIEFRMLCAFIQSRGRILSRQQLIDSVWGTGKFVSDRVIDNHVVNIRRKFEPDPACPRYLISVRGMGYRFDG